MALRDEDRLCLVQDEEQNPRAADHLLAGSVLLAKESRNSPCRSTLPRVAQMPERLRFPNAVRRGTGLGTSCRDHSVAVDGKLLSASRRRPEARHRSLRLRPGASGRHSRLPRRRKIEHQVAKAAHEHIIIFTDAGKTTQIWQWVKREPGKPVACREHTLSQGPTGDALIQKLQAFGCQHSTKKRVLPWSTSPAASAPAFDVERVTKRFYDRFKTEHAAFLKFIKGIPDDDMQRWYASLMLNRLMFIYSSRRRAFSTATSTTSRNKLAESKRTGKDKFLPTISSARSSTRVSRKTRRNATPAHWTSCSGNVPYLNGGLFDGTRSRSATPTKSRFPTMRVRAAVRFLRAVPLAPRRPPARERQRNQPRRARLHLREVHQPEADGGVLHQGRHHRVHRQNTIIPFLFDAAGRACRSPSKASGSVWRFLARRSRPLHLRRCYARASTCRCRRRSPPGCQDVSQARRTGTGPPPTEYALPTETWREDVARRAAL